MPKKGKKGGKGKKGKKGKGGKGKEEVQSDPPEVVMKEVITQYNAACEANGVVPYDAFVQKFKDALNDEEGPAVPSKLLIGDPLGPAGFKALADGITASRMRSTKALYLWKADVRDDGINDVVRILRHLTELEKVELMDCRLSSLACMSLAREFEGGLVLQSLTLDYNPLGDEGLRILAMAIGAGGRAPSLSLAYCGLGPESGFHISEHLLLSNRVERLNLQGNMLGGEGVVNLCTGLRESTSLVHLNLRGNSFGHDADAVAALNDALAANSSLRELDISLNPMDEVCGKMLVETLKNKELTKIEVSERMTADLYKAFKECVKSGGAKGKKGKGKKGGKGKKKK